MSARIYLLAAGAFSVGTSAYVISGVLPAVSSELHVSLTVAGLLATAFALSYAIGAPLIATLAGRWERRTLLVAALGTAAVGNAISAVATTYPLLTGGRVIAALGAAAYTPAATLFATGLLPAAERGRAVAIVFGGLTFALVIGVPAGTLLGGSMGYHGVFALVAAVCVVVAAAVRIALPTVDAPPVVGLRARFAVAADRRVLTILAVTVLGVVSAMSIYVYIVPLLRATAALDATATSGVLLAYGLGGVIGNAIGGRVTDRLGGLPTLMISLAGFGVMMATLPLTATTMVGAALALFVWSVFTWMFNPPIQSILLGISPAGGLLLALNASAIYFGVALAGVVGGAVISLAGVTALPVVGTVLAVVVFALTLSLRRDLMARRELVPA